MMDTISRNYVCPQCGAMVEYKETVNSGKMWFCSKCRFCTSFERKLKPRTSEEEKKEFKPLTPEVRMKLMNVLLM
jgi:ribosomal protein L37AE/L43A